ncbi:hypothetical protein [Clostridium beijerinckii]|uniref:hypothetical protein n=1 Tax=Clostridium beijerinckii TaxID=1520 RepID=UPI00098BD5FE|nr:hypothetical protein [Clostridium beijerinckii]MBA8937211.1 isopentenyldiphosphate isomerase [Clostridium beijerinckii]NRU40323.1 isopentenyldiphosphate isomerase [Clostridium beijerinckii]NSA96400.1 isopentenyldiphosphate isomerase [Clostridium beijerinckii]OOM66037.1 pyrimidine (deoxy)nucleoside triphosphate pyrophosphohydrolase [Clostridium beijerinckii]OOM72072.1 pyrimidine (deoxy)nucleoside triphosphate pyrophosphohydrolase [Clostridium beijerinckii]
MGGNGININNVVIKANEKLRETNVRETIMEANSLIVEEELILFVSFDLVNSTKFKTYNYSNWFDAIFTITKSIRKEVEQIDENFQLWRSIGDEVVFTVVVCDEKKLEDIIQKLFCILNKIHMEIKSGEIFKNGSFKDREIEELREQNILSVKATSWIALVSKDNSNRGSSLKYNIEYEYSIADDTRVVEFQGNDIDTGFRISKRFTNPRRLTLSLELAYMLSKSKKSKPKLHIIGYDRLRGIWDQKLYPIIWYHDEYEAGTSLRDSFFYDENEEQELVKKYIENIRKEETNGKNLSVIDISTILEKIIADRNLVFKMDKIYKNFDQSRVYSSSKALNIPSEYIEIHCVAVCMNSEGKIFMAQRSDTRKTFPGLWEFGCCKMIIGKNFSEVLVEGYKKEFNIDIKVEEPFKDYYFMKGNVKIPGIRYKAKITNCENIDIKGKNKYKDYKFVDIEEFEKMRKDDILSYQEFKDIILELINYK